MSHRVTACIGWMETARQMPRFEHHPGAAPIVAATVTDVRKLRKQAT
jgi:hypothetical protein